MINLLPLEEKKKIRTEYRIRLGIIVALATTALFLVSLILLAPAYLLTLSKYQFASEKLARLESEQDWTEQEKAVNVQIREVDKKINVFLGKNENQSVFSEVVTDVLGMKGNTIKIKNISYESSNRQERLVVAGRADDRDSLASFIENLKKNPSFTTVDIPISSYIKSTDIDFSIILSRAPLPSKKQ